MRPAGDCRMAVGRFRRVCSMPLLLPFLSRGVCILDGGVEGGDSALLFLLLYNRSQLVRSTYLTGLGRGRGSGDRAYVLTIEIVF
jgi:hypothetical protein